MQLSTRIITAADLADLSDDHPAEIVDGVLVEKVSPSIGHGGIAFALGRALGMFAGVSRPGCPGGWLLSIDPEIELEPSQVYRPDVAGWRLSRAPAERLARSTRIAPDWTCEVLSSSNAWRDVGPKQRGYHRAHVGHYWIVDPERRILHVMRWGEAGYTMVFAASVADVVRAEPFEAIELDVGELFRMAGLES